MHFKKIDFPEPTEKSWDYEILPLVHKLEFITYWTNFWI